jgi:hypothetical protein
LSSEPEGDPTITLDDDLNQQHFQDRDLDLQESVQADDEVPLPNETACTTEADVADVEAASESGSRSLESPSRLDAFFTDHLSTLSTLLRVIQWFCKQ